MQYVIRRAVRAPTFPCGPDSEFWRVADVAHLDQFHENSSAHRPQTSARLLYDELGIYVSFQVTDRYVICTRTEHQTLTSKDSCVELFLQPFGDKGYLNFEMNCGGALLLFYVTDPTRTTPGVFRRKEVVSRTLIESMRIAHSAPHELRTEVAEPLAWSVEYLIPNALLESFVGPLGAPAQRRWRGNLFKCAESSSHPHWASWHPIGKELNFHVPERFGNVVFDA